MTYIPIIAPIIASQHRGRKTRTAGMMMLFITGILFVLGFYIFRQSFTVDLPSISFQPIFLIIIAIALGLVVVTTIIYKAEMTAENDNNAPSPKNTQSTSEHQYASYTQRMHILQHCPACHNPLDDNTLHGLIDNDYIFCQYCGEKIHR